MILIHRRLKRPSRGLMTRAYHHWCLSLFFFFCASQMLRPQWRRTIPVTSDPSGAPYRPISVWLLSSDACHLTPLADNQTINTSLRTALLGVIYWQTYIFLLARTYHVNGSWRTARPYGKVQTTVSHRQLGLFRRATFLLLIATCNDDSNVFVPHHRRPFARVNRVRLCQIMSHSIGCNNRCKKRLSE